MLSLLTINLPEKCPRKGTSPILNNIMGDTLNVGLNISPNEAEHKLFLGALAWRNPQPLRVYHVSIFLLCLKNNITN